MYMHIKSVSNPRRPHKGVPVIDLDMVTDRHGECTCTVGPMDKTPYRFDKGDTPVTNADLYNRAEAGEFGNVAE